MQLKWGKKWVFPHTVWEEYAYIISKKLLWNICNFVYIPTGKNALRDLSFCVYIPLFISTSSDCSFRCAQPFLALGGCRNQLSITSEGTSALTSLIQGGHLCTVSPGVQGLPSSLGLLSWHEWCGRYSCLQPCSLDGSWTWTYVVDSVFSLFLSLAPSPLLLTGPWASLITLFAWDCQCTLSPADSSACHVQIWWDSTCKCPGVFCSFSLGAASPLCALRPQRIVPTEPGEMQQTTCKIAVSFWSWKSCKGENVRAQC